MSSPPTSKRIKTSVSNTLPPQLLTQQQINPFQQRLPAYEGIPMPPVQVSPQNPRKRRSSPQSNTAPTMAAPVTSTATSGNTSQNARAGAPEAAPKKKGRTNTPWTAEEEQRLKTMRDAGRSWSEIAKAFQSVALRDAIKEYEANKWKVIGQKVGKPAKACEQYAKEHFKNI
ncbi:uncharacterized protein ACLA_091850 [Aspergillus clavatus NRRL 1]|uniref:MYB DNA-binding domain protein n=1 Tax=Aspergillus clavatus (strain ATCC 1007 / CBS 513.65 / DSM 816 / NCTC 3887 / NRRL 1 / QM 1276 / 107) TaxID=344612 RepID=A1CF38_ASPCL|nr:uncharacterized protein ACLA_091850 [Aspergillus clavatus NRRL 1]EAW11487.1 hypothetical protein ACLA_091850 [Aspergillus clavatus NRRL 1]